jgi:hypothetical protein
LPGQYWDDRHWAGYLRQEDVRHRTAELGGEAPGLASLMSGHDEVELGTFGLVPGQISKGPGGAFLTLIARLA